MTKVESHESSVEAITDCKRLVAKTELGGWEALLRNHSTFGSREKVLSAKPPPLCKSAFCNDFHSYGAFFCPIPYNAGIRSSFREMHLDASSQAKSMFSPPQIVKSPEYLFADHEQVLIICYFYY